MTSLPPKRGNWHGKNDRPRGVGWLVVACVALILIVLLFPRAKKVVSGKADSPEATKEGVHSEMTRTMPRIIRPMAAMRTSEPRKTADEIVAEKVRLFGQHRRAIAERIAKRRNEELPPEVDAFFKAIDSGDWDTAHSLWRDMAIHANHQYTYSKYDRPEQEPYWETVLDTYGVAEQAHKWPAQQLLDYGNTMLASLRPGEVYVGGTDDGRWVPELLNETSDDPHIMLTQNALADTMYLDYLQELYGDQFNALTAQDSQQAFQQYVADAQKRLQHDLDFPDEPKQVLPGENLQMVDGKLQYSGVTSVMQINQVLLQMLAQKNPDLTFGLQESFPLQNTYAGALPDGPLMALNAQSDETPFTEEVAQQSVDYWNSAAKSLLADPQAIGSDTTLEAYSHNVDATANLLAANNFTDEAEQAYALASQIWPGNPNPVNGLARLLTQTGHADQAQALVDQFVSKYPDQKTAIQQPQAWAIQTTVAP